MRTWRLALLSLLLCTTGLGCSDDPEPAPDGGVRVDAGTDPADSGADAGTDPADSGSDGGTDPADSGSDAGTDPGDAGADGGTSGGDGGTDAGPAGDPVHVRNFTRYLTASGFEERPRDFAEDDFGLFVVEGDDLVPVAGMATGPGEYVFPDVPRVTYYLKVGSNYVVTDSRRVDVSVNLLGRPDVVQVEDGSVASVSVNGLVPWLPRSSLQLISEQVGYSAGLNPDVPSGATSVNQEDVFVASVSGPLVRFEAEKGDRAWVMQMHPRTLGTLPDGGPQDYVSAVSAFQLPPFSHDGSQPLRVEGTLQPLALNELPLDWRISEFAPHAAEVHPTATLRTNSLLLHPVAYGPAEGWIGYSGELLQLDRPREEPSDAVGTLVYGNPFPASWDVIATATTTFSTFLQIPDEPPLRIAGSMVVSDRPAGLSAGPLVPRMRPPLNLTLDGTEAYTARTVTAGAHVIAWQPPAAGTPNAYVVGLRRLEKFEGVQQRFSRAAGSIYTHGSATSVRLPAGMLQPGGYYYLTVRAVRADGYDVASKPFTLIDQIVYSTGTAISGLLTVPAQTP